MPHGFFIRALRAFALSWLAVVAIDSARAAPVKGEDYGLFDDPTCSTDQTTPLRNFIAGAAGKIGVLPPGTFCIKSTTGTLEITADGTEIVGYGVPSKIVWAAPTGSAIAPVIVTRGKFVTLRNFNVDHAAAGTTYVDPTYYPGTNGVPQYWGGVAVVIEGDDDRVFDMRITNGFDNCLGLGRVDHTTGVAVPNSPTGVLVSNVHTAYCGYGYHVQAQAAGGIGIDVGNASAAIANVHDEHSVVNFAVDIGAGPTTMLTNAIGEFAHDTGNLPGAGTGLYVGAGNSVISNIDIISPDRRGVWVDGLAGAATTGTALSNINVRTSGEECAYVKGASVWSGLQCILPSYGHAGAYSAIQIDTDYGRTTSPYYLAPVLMTGVNFYGSDYKYAIDVTGGGEVHGRIEAENLSGTVAKTNLPSTTKGLAIVEHSASGETVTADKFTVSGNLAVTGGMTLGDAPVGGGVGALCWDETAKTVSFNRNFCGAGLKTIYVGANQEALGLHDSDSGHHLTFKVETATNEGGLGYWLGSQFGTTSLYGDTRITHLLGGDATPNLSNCGASPSIDAASGDLAGRFTTGTGNPSACTINFHRSFPGAAYCTVTMSSGNAGVGYYLSPPAASSFTVNLSSGTSGVSFNYVCVGR